MDVTVELLRSTLDEKSQEISFVIDAKTNEKVKLDMLNYKNFNLFKEKGYLLHKVVKHIASHDNEIDIYV